MWVPSPATSETANTTLDGTQGPSYAIVPAVELTEQGLYFADRKTQAPKQEGLCPELHAGLSLRWSSGGSVGIPWLHAPCQW
jgi:hypothetical protein